MSAESKLRFGTVRNIFLKAKKVQKFGVNNTFFFLSSLCL